MERGRPALAARRVAAGLTQEALAEALGVDRSTVMRWERGRTTPQPWLRPELARALGIACSQLDDLLAPAAWVATGPDIGGTRRVDFHGAAVTDEDLRDRLAHAASVDTRTLTLLAGHADLNRELDRALGAGAAYPQLLGYLDTLDSLRRYTIGSREGLADLYADAAALAGWQSLDAGQLARAWDHHEQAKVAGREGSSPAAFIHATAQQAYVLLELHKVRSALDLASYAIGLARGTVPALLMSWLYAVQGEMYAAAADPAGTQTAFEEADKTLARSEWPDPQFPYLMLNPVHLARWRGNARARLGHASAIDDLQTALNDLEGSFVRARAGLLVDLARSLTAAHRHGEAEHHLEQAQALASQVGSARQRRRVQHLQSVLRSA